MVAKFNEEIRSCAALSAQGKGDPGYFVWAAQALRMARNALEADGPEVALSYLQGLEVGMRIGVYAGSEASRAKARGFLYGLYEAKGLIERSQAPKGANLLYF